MRTYWLERAWTGDGATRDGVLVDVERTIHVRVTALDPSGDPIVVEASGLEARVIQHEMDHLDGRLIVDRAPRDQRREAMRILRERSEAA